MSDWDRTPESIQEYIADLESYFAWNNVYSFQGIQQTMISYFMGRIFTTPWHPYPVDEETVPLLENLRHLNELGFVTIGSQPGICEDWQTQRGYIEGFIRKDLVTREFLRNLEEIGIYALILDIDGKEISETNNYNDDLYHLTIEHGEDGTRKTHTKFRKKILLKAMSGMFEIPYDIKNFIDILRSDSYPIFVTDLDQCRNNIVEKMIEVLE